MSMGWNRLVRTLLDTSIMNVSAVSNNVLWNIHLVSTINTSMMDISAAHNGADGIFMYSFVLTQV